MNKFSPYATPVVTGMHAVTSWQHYWHIFAFQVEVQLATELLLYAITTHNLTLNYIACNLLVDI